MKRALLLALLTVASCGPHASQTIYKNGSIVSMKMTGEKVMVLCHIYPVFTHDGGVYEVRHADGRTSEVKSFEIEN